MGLMEEQTACRVAVADLRGVQARLRAILADLYDSAPAYAGEVESIKEATDNAIRILGGADDTRPRPTLPDISSPGSGPLA